MIATKGIMARPDGAWEAGSDPDELLAACDRSLEADKMPFGMRAKRGEAPSKARSPMLMRPSGKLITA